MLFREAFKTVTTYNGLFQESDIAKRKPHEDVIIMSEHVDVYLEIINQRVHSCYAVGK